MPRPLRKGVRLVANDSQDPSSLVYTGANHTGQSKAHVLELLVGWLVAEPGIYLFGGLLRHLISPNVHPGFGDVDLIALDAAPLEQLRDRFGYVFREVSRPGQFPRYFFAKSPVVTKHIQLVLMNSRDEAIQFAVDGPQYDIDRVAFSEGCFYFDNAIGEKPIRAAINAKRATLVRVPRNTSHFACNRHQIEQRHRLKLLQKGFAIID